MANKISKKTAFMLLMAAYGYDVEYNTETKEWEWV